MSFGDLEYQETSSHFLTRLLKSLKQEQIILDAVQNPIDDVEEYPDSRLVESQIGTKDTLGAVAKQVTDTWVLPAEPSYKTKLWLWFREGWRLKDHSCQGNQAFVEQVEPSPYAVVNHIPLKRKVRDDALTDGRYYSITNGLSHYVRVEDSATNRITDLLESENEITFSIFFSPFQEYVMDDNHRAPVFSKLDDDQIQNGIKVQTDEAGKIYYSLVYQGSSYHIETVDAAIPIIDVGEFMEAEFTPEEFVTSGALPHQNDPDIEAPDWVWLFFTFSKVTRQLHIYKVAEDFSAAEVEVTPDPQIDETGIRTTFGLHLPMNEGNTNPSEAYTAYDVTANDNNAVFTVDPAISPVFVTSPNRALRFSGAAQRAIIANHATINTLSVFTIAFKIRLSSYAVGAPADYIITKGVSGAGGALIPVGGFTFSMVGGGGVKDLLFAFKPNSDPVTQNLTAANAIVNLNQWYDVILTYDGTTYTLQAGAVTNTLARSADVFTNSQSIYIGDTVSAMQGDIADVIIDKGTAWGAGTKAWYASRTAGFKSIDLPWKPLKPPEPEEPLPVVRPMSLEYELFVPDTTDFVKVNQPAATTPYVSQYNVPGGTASTTAEVLKYNVADGTTGGSTTNPFVTVYSLSPASSTGNLNAGELAVGQYITDAASVLEGIKPTEITMYLKQGSTEPEGGNIYLGIIKANGTTVKFGAAISPGSLTGSYQAFTKQGNFTIGSQYTTVVGDAIGVIWEGATDGTIDIQRGGSGVHYEDSSRSAQNRYDGGWGTPNDEFSIAGIVRTGGEVVAGSNPYHKLTANNYVVANYQINSTLEGIVPTRIIWRVKRVGSAVSATLRCAIRSNTGATVATLGSTISFNSIGSTVQDLEFINRDNTIQWNDSYRITLEFVNVTGINESSVYLDVNFNTGTGAGMVGGTSIVAQYYKSTGTPGYVNVSPTSDWAGKIYTGGYSFTSYKALDATTTRVGEKVNISTSPNISRIFGDKISKFHAILKKQGSPTGPIRIRMYGDNGVYQGEFNTIIDASSLTTSDAVYVFIFPTNNYVMAQGSKIAVHFENGTATDKVLVKINTDVAAGTAGDAHKSILSSWNGTAWVDETSYDIAAEMFTGGIPDLTSRPAVAMTCNSEFSRLMQDKITQARFRFKKFGAPTGTITIKSVRGSDGADRDIIGTINMADISSSVWTTVSRSNFNALHYLGVSDKIVIEFLGGNATNYLMVQVKKDSTYDDEDTIYEEFNGATWLQENPSWDIAAELWIGGDTYLPDPGTPYVEPPDYYDHDLFIAGQGSDHLSGLIDTFYGMRVRDFRIFTETLTLDEINIMYANKYSKRGDRGKIALVGYFALTDQVTE